MGKVCDGFPKKIFKSFWNYLLLGGGSHLPTIPHSTHLNPLACIYEFKPNIVCFSSGCDFTVPRFVIKAVPWRTLLQEVLAIIAPVAGIGHFPNKKYCLFEAESYQINQLVWGDNDSQYLPFWRAPRLCQIIQFLQRWL